MAAPRPRVWVSQPLFDDIVDRLAAHCEVDAVGEVTEHDQAAIGAALREADGALVTLNERIGPAELAQAPKLRAIANVGVGYNNLDIPALDAAGVIATNTPDVLTETTADLGFALLMAAARRITESERWLREGQWRQWSFSTMLGADVHGSTLGILGMGRIGQAIARRGHHGFGMKVLYHNRSRLPEAVEQGVGARYVDFDTLLAQSDHLVLVLPYSQASHHIIDAAALAKMKPSATLVNIARGGLVDELALADALANGRLFAAGLDVYEGEPVVRPELLALRNVVLTPHTGSASLATRRAMVQLAVDNLLAALGFGPRAGHPANPVTAKKTSTATVAADSITGIVGITAIAGTGKAAAGKR
ncbi:2-hydroxyacid dehydrogenase [Pseudoxanthomonas suwonensis]|uniref:2-hydroxyacid dehydrogenase n=1 Tax=Pseudoxanthomonas suwonensis TaxID=314722 RepID=UPI00048E3E61|nr:D-glycerate dehydrogenase [Pseudoxanthomonas suwonensis]